MKQFCSFSEAIREGAKLRPQATQLFNELPSGVVGSCAYGAGYEALTGEIDLYRSEQIYEYVATAYPYMEMVQPSDCPLHDCDEAPMEGLSEVVLHLNDDHEWTREAIADWLEREEEKLGFVTLVESEQSVPTGVAHAVTT